MTAAASGRSRSFSTRSSISSAVTSGRAASWTATSSVSTRSRPAATDSERLSPPTTAAAASPTRSSQPAGTATMTGPTLCARANASSDHSTSGRPASGTKAFGPPAPSLSPEPAAAMTADAAGASGRRLGAEALLQQLVQVGLGALLVLAERVHELGREDLLRPGVHLLLPGREALLPFANGEVADNLGQFEDVARLDLLAVVLEAAVPVLGHVRNLAGQHPDHLLNLFARDHPSQSRPVGVLARHHDRHVVVQDLDGQIVPLLAQEILGLLLQHNTRPVVRVDDVVAFSEGARDGAELVLDVYCVIRGN